MKLTNKDIFIDVETYSECDISLAGTYKYAMHPTTKLLLLSFAIGEDSTTYTYDVATLGIGSIPSGFINMLSDPTYRKHAHNAMFEMLVLYNTLNVPIMVEQWYCSMACVAFCGLPLKLEDSANTLAHNVKKLKSGTALIKLFSTPDKNGKRTLWSDRPREWAEFVAYNVSDVQTEQANILSLPELPEIFEDGIERDMWCMDMRINLRGVGVNTRLAKNADEMCAREDRELIDSVRHLGIDNVNSRKQLLDFLASRGFVVNSLKADDYDTYRAMAIARDDEIIEAVLNVKQSLSLTSASKFQKFVDTETNGRIYGTLQYYGANRTGRWSGRGAQPQNLKRNEMPLEALCTLRTLVLNNDYDSVKMYFGDVKSNIVELCRTVVEPAEGNVFLATDFSAIEARVTAWIADEKWRLDVFNTHGKIYEASAAMMFKMNVEDIKKGSLERIKGKYAELALGFGGWVGAFKRFGADKYMSDKEILDTAKAWREANKNIVAMWADVHENAVSAVRDFGEAKTTKFGVTYQGIEYNGRRWLQCFLPSGRRLMYYDPKLICDSRNQLSFSYRRMANEQDTWFGMLVENVVQAISRDLLVEKMVRLHRVTRELPVLHVHDEIVIERPAHEAETWKRLLDQVMGEEITWAKGLPLKGDTSILMFYMKE